MKLLDNYDKKQKEINLDDPTFYVCGPTVYNYIHIGNARPMIVFDILFRVLKRIAKKPMYISNFTDVDDKIIKKANENNVSEKEIAEKFILEFEKDREALNILKPTLQPKVTDFMSEIIEFINNLVKTGFAYEVDGDVFFRAFKVKEYGKLSNKKIDELQESDNIINSEKKENPADFVLWKNTNEGIKWESPFGKGRPGWHTECVVMIEKIVKRKLDLHGGGVDLKFPHHENEIAQSLALFDHSLAEIWMHNGHISIDGEKMSKSLGNFILIKDILKKVDPNILRLLIIKTSYSAPIDFSDELVQSSEKEWNKIRTTLKSASLNIQTKNKKINNINFKTESIIIEPLLNNLKDNLNTPNAISELMILIKKLNQALRLTDLNNIIEIFDAIRLGLLLLGFKFEPKILNMKMLEMINEWEKFKKEKDWNKADSLRKKLIKGDIL